MQGATTLARSPSARACELDAAFATLAQRQASVLVVTSDPLFNSQRELSVESASLANRCVARPDEKVITAADRVFGK
jgi:hypothetical protein